MTTASHSGTAGHAGRLQQFALADVAARAKRLAAEHLVLLAVAVVLLGGGAAGAAVALQSSGTVPASACPSPGPPYYAYAVPPDPAHVPGAGSGATSWGWQPHIRPLTVGNWVRGRDGDMWKVTGIVTMPGVEPVCRPFAIVGLGSANSPFNKGLVMAGRLVLQPIG